MDLEKLPESLLDILRGYGALCSPRYLEFPIDLSFPQVHDFFVKRLLLNSHFVAYPPSPEYQKIFWKWVVEKLEQLIRTEASTNRVFFRNIINIDLSISLG